MRQAKFLGVVFLVCCFAPLARAQSDEAGAGDLDVAPIPAPTASTDEQTAEPTEGVSATAPAEEEGAARKITLPITVGAEVGLVIPSVLSDLGVGPAFTLRAGYLLPFLEKRIEVFVSGSYTQSSTQIKRTDPRLPNDGSYTYKLTEREVPIHIGGVYRLRPPGTQLNFYGELAFRLGLQQTQGSGKASGESFGTYKETATSPGGLAALGAEYILGPGAIAANLNFAIGKLNQRMTGSSLAGGLGFAVGYHLFF